ncbi:MAG: class I SAM-dependent methyltransferase [Hyphomicrobiales bacterium]|nr:class I SAM-dependent methyltransferase [Hyphomicrobiales bacterium]
MTIFLESERIIAAAASAHDKYEALKILKQLPLADYGEILFLEHSYEALKPILPTVPNPDLQKIWNGHSGRDLLIRSVSAIQSLELGIARYKPTALNGAVLLDFGCGWGRLTRFLPRLTSAANIWALDPMESSLEQCRIHRVPGNFRLSDRLPTSLPLDCKFDVAFSYSVFTHLSDTAALCALKALRNAAAENALLMITIRPIEYWRIRTDLDRDALAHSHATHGYAYHPTADEVYGDSSMSLHYAKSLLVQANWKFVGFDSLRDDPFQTRVFSLAA